MADADDAEPTGPRVVSLDDLFGDARPAGAADRAADEGTGGAADSGPGDATEMQAGSWADAARTDVAGSRAETAGTDDAGSWAETAGTDDAGSWADVARADGADAGDQAARPARLADPTATTVEEPDEVGTGPDTAPRGVTFEELSTGPGDSAVAGDGPRGVELGEPGRSGDGDVPDGAGAPRAVSFEDLSSRRGRSVAPGRSTRRSAGDQRRPGGAAAGKSPGAGETDAGETGAEAAPERERTPAEQEARAKEICLRLLTDRARTVKELGDALRRKEVPDEIANRVLARFDEVGLVDDTAFAGQWVRSRHRHRGLGKRAIALELHRKGVDREIADEALTGIDDDAERERARDLVAKRLRSLPVGTREQRQATARKLVGMLARKGYGPGVAYGVVKEEIAAAGADADELGEAPPED